MSYQIYNNTASIGFHSGIGDVLLMKWAVKEIAIIKGDTIRISTDSCESSVVFRHKDVSAPATASATVLVNLMNGWLGDYSPPAGPHE
jgi:hypothetical protein